MATTKNLCAQIPIDLHERVSEERERLGQTTSEYIANLIQDYGNSTSKNCPSTWLLPASVIRAMQRPSGAGPVRTLKKLSHPHATGITA